MSTLPATAPSTTLRVRVRRRRGRGDRPLVALAAVIAAALLAPLVLILLDARSAGAGWLELPFLDDAPLWEELCRLPNLVTHGRAGASAGVNPNV